MRDLVFRFGPFPLRQQQGHQGCLLGARSNAEAKQAARLGAGATPCFERYNGFEMAES
jgi:hypothetical protein